MVPGDVTKGLRGGNGPGRAAAVAAATMAALLLFAPGALGAWPAPQRVSAENSTYNDQP